MSNNKQLIVYSPLYAEMLTENLVDRRRELRIEWLLIRDSLCVQENAEYLDLFQVMKDRIFELRELIKENKEAITAQLN